MLVLIKEIFNNVLLNYVFLQQKGYTATYSSNYTRIIQSNSGLLKKEHILVQYSEMKKKNESLFNEMYE